MIGTASLSAAACSRMTWPMRGCWTTERHSADVSATGLSRISCGTADLADVVAERGDSIRSTRPAERERCVAIATTIEAIKADG